MDTPFGMSHLLILKPHSSRQLKELSIEYEHFKVMLGKYHTQISIIGQVYRKLDR